jgi:hypothetical protein
VRMIKLKLETRELEIKKLPLGKYAEILEALGTIPEILNSIENIQESDFLTVLPKLIAKATPEFFEIISIATDLEKNEVEQLGLVEVIDIVEAIVEVNKFKSLFEKIKKMKAQTKPQPKTQKTG